MIEVMITAELVGAGLVLLVPRAGTVYFAYSCELIVVSLTTSEADCGAEAGRGPAPASAELCDVPDVSELSATRHHWNNNNNPIIYIFTVELTTYFCQFRNQGRKGGAAGLELCSDIRYINNIIIL